MQPEYGETWFTSWHNFVDAPVRKDDKFVIHDTTLRDGEQQAGVLFTVEEKVEIAKALDRVGVDRIEAGMVAVSEDDRRAIREIVDLGLRSEIWTIVRSLEKDVDYAVECGVVGAGVIILANEQYCDVFGWTAEEAIDKAVHAATAAKEGGLQTTLLVADSPRMSHERLQLIVTTADSSGAYDAVALMDTFGTLSPVGTAHLVATVREMTHLPIELHPHNDFGLATANALAGLGSGADIIHTSVLGLGERVGNQALEELAVAAPFLYGFQHEMDLSQIHEVAEIVRRSAQVEVSPNKPVIGSSYSQIESGAVASEFVRWTSENRDLQWLYPFVPGLTGGPQVELVLGKGSGLANVDWALQKAGIELDGDKKRELLLRVKDRAIAQHRDLTTEEFTELAGQFAKREE